MSNQSAFCLRSAAKKFLMRSAIFFIAALFYAGPSIAQAPIWPGQSGNYVGFAAAPGWPGSFTATACPSSPASGTSWANATIVTNCTYSTSSHISVSCHYCEFLYVDFKTSATNDDTVLVSGQNILFMGDRFQSNCVECGDVSVTSSASAVYFFYDSTTPLVSYYISPPGTGCSEVTPGNIGCTGWPAAGINTFNPIEETGFTPGAITPSNATAVNGNKGYEFGFNLNSSTGTVWIDSCDIWGFGDAIVSQTSTAQQTITNTWIHDAAYPSEQSYHVDGYGYSNGAVGPNNVTLIGTVTAIYGGGGTDGLALQAATGGYQNIYVAENFFSGDGATIAWCHPGSVQCTNSYFYGNTFGTDMQPGGPVYGFTTTLGSGSQWICNRISFRSGTSWTDQNDNWTPTSGMNGQYFLWAQGTAPNYAYNNSTDTGGNTVCGVPAPSTINFGTQASGTSSSAQTVTLYANNTANLTGVSVALAGGTQFSIVSNGCGSTVTAGTNCAITVKFSPTGLGPQTDTLKITDNTPGVTSPQLVPLAGTGINSTAVVLSPSSENFGSINVGSSSSPATFTLTNNNSTTATSISPSVPSGADPSDFSITNSGAGSCSAAGGSLAQGVSCTFTVTFTPGATGSRSATLSVSYSGGDGASPQTAALSGTGTSSGVSNPVVLSGSVTQNGNSSIQAK